MTPSSASSSIHVASRRHSVLLAGGSTSAVTFDLTGVVVLESIVVQRTTGVALADGTFPVSVGPRQDGDDGEGGLAPREGARGPLYLIQMKAVGGGTTSTRVRLPKPCI